MAESIFPFLKLPRELRDKIYHFILVEDTLALKPIASHVSEEIRQVQQSAPNQHQRDKTGLIDTAIFRTNKRIYSEAFEVFVEKNTFLIAPSTEPRENVRKHARKFRAELYAFHSAFQPMISYLSANTAKTSLLLSLHDKHWVREDFEEVLIEPLKQLKNIKLHIHVDIAKTRPKWNHERRSMFKKTKGPFFEGLKELDGELHVDCRGLSRFCGKCDPGMDEVEDEEGGEDDAVRDWLTGPVRRSIGFAKAIRDFRGQITKY